MALQQILTRTVGWVFIAFTGTPDPNAHGPSKQWLIVLIGCTLLAIAGSLWTDRYSREYARLYRERRREEIPTSYLGEVKAAMTKGKVPGWDRFIILMQAQPEAYLEKLRKRVLVQRAVLFVFWALSVVYIFPHLFA